MKSFISDLFDLSGKIALITGASSGLGKRFALTLAKAGADVVLVARRKDRLDEVAKEITALGRKAHVQVIDVHDPHSIKAGVETILEAVDQIDILVNNAGTGVYTPLLNSELSDWQYTFDVNVRGAWLMTQAIVPSMIETNVEGSIINIASINGLDNPGANLSAYCCSKSGLIQMTKVLSKELSKAYLEVPIRVNSIAPGLFHTEMTEEHIKAKKEEMSRIIPLGYIADPEDLDGMILYLASNKASRYVTGTCMVVDGGLGANAY